MKYLNGRCKTCGAVNWAVQDSGCPGVGETVLAMLRKGLRVRWEDCDEEPQYMPCEHFGGLEDKVPLTNMEIWGEKKEGDK